MSWYLTEEGYYVSGAGREFDHLPETTAEPECNQACAHCTQAQLGLCAGLKDVDEEPLSEVESD